MLRRPAMPAFADALVFAFPILLLCVPRGAGVFLGCVGLLLLLRFRGMGRTWQAYRDVLVPLTITVFAFLLVYLASRMFFHTHWDVLDNPSRTLLAILTCWVILHAAPDPRMLWRGITVALVAALVIVCYQRFVQGIPRPSAWVQAIAFANMVAAFGLIGFARAGNDRRTHALAWFNLACALLILAVNGTRSALLALLVVMLPMLLLRYGRLGKRAFLAAVLLIGALAVGSYYLPDSPVKARVDLVMADVHQFQQGNAATSVGSRLKVWEIAVHSIAEHPVMGVGVGQFARILHAAPYCQNLKTLPCDLEHAHNDILEAASTTGVPGLIVVLALFLVPAGLFWHTLRACRARGDAVGVSLSGGGIGMTAATIICGLTQVTMAHQANMVFYSGTIGLLLALAATRAGSRTHDDTVRASGIVLHPRA